jgi:hydroxymethylbilane synthase
VAQGAIGVERRANDDRTGAMLAAIHHGPTGQRLAAERALLAALDGSCQTPIGGLADLTATGLHLRAEILKPDGSAVLADAGAVPVADGPAFARDMAARLLDRAGPGFF